MFRRKKGIISIPRLGSRLSGWWPVNNLASPRKLEKLVRTVLHEGESLLHNMHPDLFNMGYFDRVICAQKQGDLAELAMMRAIYRQNMDNLRHVQEVERRLCQFSLQYLKKEETGNESEE